MAAGRRIVEGERYVKAGRWKTWGPSLLLGSDFAGSTLGIVGFGRIGQAMAKRASGFDMRVIIDPVASPNPELDAESVDLGTRCCVSRILCLCVRPCCLRRWA